MVSGEILSGGIESHWNILIFAEEPLVSRALALVCLKNKDQTSREAIYGEDSLPGMNEGEFHGATSKKS